MPLEIVAFLFYEKIFVKIFGKLKISLYICGV